MRTRALVAEPRARPGIGLGPLYDLYDERCDAFEADPPGDDWDASSSRRRNSAGAGGDRESTPPAAHGGRKPY